MYIPLSVAVQSCANGRMMIACCNDGTKAVIFKTGRIDIPETPKEEEWLSGRAFHNNADQAYAR